MDCKSDTHLTDLSTKEDKYKFTSVFYIKSHVLQSSKLRTFYAGFFLFSDTIKVDGMV